MKETDAEILACLAQAEAYASETEKACPEEFGGYFEAIQHSLRTQGIKIYPGQPLRLQFRLDDGRIACQDGDGRWFIATGRDEDDSERA